MVLCTRSENKEPGTCTAQLRNRVLCTRSENKEPGTCTAPEPGTVSGAGECQDNISIYELKQTCSLSGADPDAILHPNFIEIVLYKEKWYSMNNSRLWCLKESTFGTRCGSGTGYCIWSRRCRSRCSSGTGYYTYSGTGYCICLLLRLNFPLGELEDLIPIPLWYLL